LDLSPAVDRVLAAIRSSELPTDVAALERLVGPVQRALTAASSFFLGAVGLFVRALLALAISLYMSLEAPAILFGFESFMDREQSVESHELLRRVAESWTDFLRGQFILMVIIGVVVSVGGLVLGLPGALALGLLAGVLEVLPNIGPIIATVPAVAIALVAGSQVLPVSNLVFALIVLAFYAGVQLLENNLVVPRVIGKAVALPSVVIMVAVIVGAEVGGVLGAFVAAPAAATLREVLAYTVDKIRGLDPYPELRGAAPIGEALAESE
jgi:predicted PurR-regulated permease PerM